MISNLLGVILTTLLPPKAPLFAHHLQNLRVHLLPQGHIDGAIRRDDFHAKSQGTMDVAKHPHGTHQPLGSLGSLGSLGHGPEPSGEGATLGPTVCDTQVLTPSLPQEGHFQWCHEVQIPICSIVTDVTVYQQILSCEAGELHDKFGQLIGG